MVAKKKKYDVGILGWWYGKNYGSVLTYYGLNKAIESLGHSVLMINETLGYNGFRVSWPLDTFPLKFAKRVGYNYTEQRHYSKMPLFNEEVDTFVVGSDQLWNPLIGRVNDDLFLDFVGPENRRVAYATSFGNRGIGKFKPEFIAKHTENLQKFAAISVREGYAVNTAKDVFGVDATKVVDPVFLLLKENYETLAAQATIKVAGDYLAVFFLDPTTEKKNVAQAIADKLGLEKILVIPNPDGGRKLARQIFDGDRFEILTEDSPENFLHAYIKAKYVVTDSFHGSAFSVIFQKPFSSIYNTRRGADRFKSLMTSLGFGESRRVYETDSPDSIRENPNVSLDIDFTEALNYIETERRMSLRWLKAALSSRTNFLGTIKEKYHSLIQEKGHKDDSDLVERPNFIANNAAWRIAPLKNATGLSVAPGAAIRGNLVWCDLPFPLLKQGAYRLTIKWSVRTTGRAINLHIRNGETGKFRVIGTVAVKEKSSAPRSDMLEFVAPEDGFTQFMLGAIHFTGEHAGAEITSIEVQEIPIAAANPVKKPSGYAEKALKLALHATSIASHGAAAKSPAKRIGKTDLAIPLNTPDRSTIIANIMKDPKVNAWKDELTDLIPDMSFYVAREMKEYTNNKVGGPADILVFPKNSSELQSVVKFARERFIPLTVLGRGSNVIVRDGGIRGLVICTTKLDYISIDDGLLKVGAGASLIETCYYLLNQGKSGLEWAAGIPGTVGGAVFMNAGTNVSDIRRTISSVRVLKSDGNIETLLKNDIVWGKRYTTFQDRKDLIILEACFKIQDSPPPELHQAMIRTVQVRENHFPLQNPNHGSTFKWWRAPRLISQAGLVGTQIGGAQVSDKQPGFIVNVKQATASDFEALIYLIIARVYDFSGFLLEPEVEIIGERPHRYERYQLDEKTESLDKR